jgi:hypothetical protein
MRGLIACIAIIGWMGVAAAAEVGGVKLADKASVAGTDLVLNGAGIRSRAIFKVYVGSLYLPQKSADAAAAVGGAGPKRVQMNMLRTVPADDFAGALNDGLKANNTEAELAAVKGQVDQLQSIMKSFGEAKEGAVVTLDHVPGQGTVVGLDGKPRGTIPGDPFNKALMKIWLGDKPIQSDLKKAMLGG